MYVDRDRRRSPGQMAGVRSGSTADGRMGDGRGRKRIAGVGSASGDKVGQAAAHGNLGRRPPIARPFAKAKAGKDEVEGQEEKAKTKAKKAGKASCTVSRSRADTETRLKHINNGNVLPDSGTRWKR